MSVAMYGAVKRGMDGTAAAAEESKSGSGSGGAPGPDLLDMEDCIDGNLCRCTGYRPIIDAARSLATDGDGVANHVAHGASGSCGGGGGGEGGEGGEGKDGCGSGSGCGGGEAERPYPAMTPEDMANANISEERVRALDSSSMAAAGSSSSNRSGGGGAAAAASAAAAAAAGFSRYSGSGRVFYQPRSLAGCQAALAAAQTEAPLWKIRLVAGNTSTGIYKAGVEDPAVLVDVTRVPELRETAVVAGKGVRVGGAASLTALVDVLRKATAAAEATSKTRPAVSTAAFDPVIRHVHRIAGFHVRNVGTVAGNLVLAKTRRFESDLATVLCGLGATVTVMRMSGSNSDKAGGAAPQQETMDLLTFLDAATVLGPVDLVLALHLPFGAPGEVFRSYKVALRPQNSHALVNAAFRVQCEQEEQGDGGGGGDGDGDEAAAAAAAAAVVVKRACLVFGAVETAHAIRATKAEAALTGKPLTSKTLQAVLAVLQEEVALKLPAPGTGAAPVDQHTGAPYAAETVGHEHKKLAYRRGLVRSFFFKYFHELKAGAVASCQARAARAKGADAASSGVAQEALARTLVDHAFQDASRAPAHRYKTDNVQGVLDPAAGGGSGQGEAKAAAGGGGGGGAGAGVAAAAGLPHAPVGLPVPKTSAPLLASGQAQFTGDMPLPPTAVHAALVLTDRSGLTVASLDTAEARQCPGFKTILTAKDIPGKNNRHCGGGPLLAPIADEAGGGAGGGKDTAVGFAGQAVAVVVADTERHARYAAGKVRVRYGPAPPAAAGGSGGEEKAAAPGEDKAGEGGAESSDEHKVVLTNDDAMGAAGGPKTYGYMKKHWPKRSEDEGGQEGLHAEVMAAVGKCALRASGRASSKSQSHFYLEPQTAWAVPQEGGRRMAVAASQQWPNGTQRNVADALGMPMNKVDVVVRRVGGGFGGKLTHHLGPATLAAVAASVLRLPVSLALTRSMDMKLCGGRHACDADYDVGFDADGRIHALSVNIKMNAGAYGDVSGFCVMSVAKAVDQVYHIPSLEVVAEGTVTALAPRTAVRGPGEIQASYIMETIIAHVALELQAAAAAANSEKKVMAGNSKGGEAKKGASSSASSSSSEALAAIAHRIRTINMIPSDDPAKLITHEGVRIEHYTMPRIWKELTEAASTTPAAAGAGAAPVSFDARVAAVETFNAAHRWRKRGIAMTPVKYYVAANFRSALVNIYEDGTVVVHHSGVEIGQGIHVKVLQMASHTLGTLLGKGPYPMDRISIADHRTSAVPNSDMTGGSTTSEACAGAVQDACRILVERMTPIVAEWRENKAKARREKREKKEKEKKEELGGGGGGGGKAAEKEPEEEPEPEPTFKDIVGLALSTTATRVRVDLSATGSFQRTSNSKCLDQPEGVAPSHGYHNFGAAVSEVEVDVLTGEFLILSTDLLYDCGKSLNPAIDMGQCEGGFMMGVGFYHREELILDEETGLVWSDGTWEYKIPCAADVPRWVRQGCVGERVGGGDGSIAF